MLFEYNHMGLEAMPDKTYNQTNKKKNHFLFKIGKEKKQLYKNSIQQFSCWQRTLFSTQQANL